ncbi:hypothetical protein HDU99_005505 [Rhizoclosmatium hyalinum]|nr:hypothetical protein HDU99_005505 [Rhizoclosmatium hyalinum]
MELPVNEARESVKEVVIIAQNAALEASNGQAINVKSEEHSSCKAEGEPLLPPSPSGHSTATRAVSYPSEYSEYHPPNASISSLPSDAPHPPEPHETYSHTQYDHYPPEHGHAHPPEGYQEGEYYEHHQGYYDEYGYYQPHPHSQYHYDEYAYNGEQPGYEAGATDEHWGHHPDHTPSATPPSETPYSGVNPDGAPWESSDAIPVNPLNYHDIPASAEHSLLTPTTVLIPEHLALLGEEPVRTKRKYTRRQPYDPKQPATTTKKIGRPTKIPSPSSECTTKQKRGRKTLVNLRQSSTTSSSDIPSQIPTSRKKAALLEQTAHHLASGGTFHSLLRLLYFPPPLDPTLPPKRIHLSKSHVTDPATNAKVFVCLVCTKEYGTANGLKYHLTQHRPAEFPVGWYWTRVRGGKGLADETARYLCMQEGCGKGYGSLAGLKYHLEHGHGHVWDDQRRVVGGEEQVGGGVDVGDAVSGEVVESGDEEEGMSDVDGEDENVDVGNALKEAMAGIHDSSVTLFEVDGFESKEEELNDDE